MQELDRYQGARWFRVEIHGKGHFGMLESVYLSGLAMPFTAGSHDRRLQSGTGGASPVVKLAMLSQLIQGLAQQFPQGQQGIQMMLKGLQMIQSSASASSAPQQAPAPPR
jgi:hypothetical protein